jgi:excisionase family DNA binding protein
MTRSLPPKTEPPPTNPPPRPRPTGPPRLGTVAEVAEYLGVPVKTLYRWRTCHTGPRASKVGKHLRYRWADVDRWLDKQAEEAA